MVSGERGWRLDGGVLDEAGATGTIWVVRNAELCCRIVEKQRGSF